MVEISIGGGRNNPFMGLIFLVVGIGVGAWGYSEFNKAKASAKWPTVEGQITSSRVDERRESRRKDGRTRTEIKYTPEISYTYNYAGKTYSGKRITFGGTLSSRHYEDAKRLVERYPKGSKVVVRVNPTSPATACLLAEVGGGIFIPIGLGAVFALFGLGVFIGGLASRRGA